jgi:hypothetical protein
MDRRGEALFLLVPNLRRPWAMAASGNEAQKTIHPGSLLFPQVAVRACMPQIGFAQMMPCRFMHRPASCGIADFIVIADKLRAPPA